MNNKLALIGTKDGKEFYLCPPDKTHSKPYSVFRVPDIREGIRARPGWKIMGADYQQIEVRIMAWLSKDEWLISALNSGKDIHSYMAADVHKIPYDDFVKIYKDEEHPLHNKYYGWRSEIKTTTFGVPYGAGPAQVARQINNSRKPGDTEPLFTEEDAEALIASYFTKAQGLAKWLKKQGLKALIDNYSKSMSGHYRFYQMPKEGNEDFDERISQIKRWAGNHPIQSSCADILKMAVGKIYLDLRGGISYGPLVYEAHFILFVHDELVLTAKDEDVDKVKQIMIDAMQWAYDQVVGLKNIQHTIDVSIADFWKKG